MSARSAATLAILVAAGALAPPAGAAGDLAVRGEVVHTMEGPPLKDGVVLIRGGKIVAVGAASRVAVPPGIEVVSAKVVTPGLVDARTVVGLAGYLNQPTDQDEIDPSAPIQPELRAFDSFNARERLVSWVREHGVTTIHTGHAPGAAISGQTMIAKTRGATAEEAIVRPVAMVAATIGASAVPGDAKKSPGTRSKLVAMLRAELVRAREYRDKTAAPGEKKPDRDLRLEILVDVLEGRLPLLVNADRHVDIETALRLAEEFGFRLVLDGAAESYELIPRIRAAKVPVIVHPTMYRSAGERENLSMETAGRLRAAGIPIAIESGYETYVPKTRVVLFEAAVAAANGLGFDGALEAITIGAARILGVDDRVGSLAPGKDGDLAMYDGDPFEYTTHCVGTVIEGEVVSRARR